MTSPTHEQPYDEAIALLQARTGLEAMTAYDRTKALLEILARKGVEAPNWAVIRSLIGKGSAGDINRAKRDFRKELGVQLGRMRGAKGMTEEASDAFAKVWLLAVEQAAKTFDEQVNAITADLERAESAQMDAEVQRDEALSCMRALEGEKAGLQSSMGSLQALVEAERAAKEQAQQMFESARAELAGQLGQTKAALESAQQETAGALERFEGMEKRFQLEIDRARQELAAERERMNKERTKELAAQATAKDRARLQMGIEQSKRMEVERKLAATKAEAGELRTQLVMAQETIRKALQSRTPDAKPKAKASATKKIAHKGAKKRSSP